MADREDIDALLIGALYGELDGADRARLDAHLASHPQDRQSLEAMRSTRGLLRDAEVASAMVEPPAAVSALLLQEAARRAPARGREGAGGLLGFLASFLRPVMAHPAMSAAAMLVVVAGTAGVLYLRGGARPVEPERASAPALSAPRSEGERIVFEQPAPQDPAIATGAALGSAAPLDSVDLDSYRVSLEEARGNGLLGKERAQDQGQLAFGPTGGASAGAKDKAAKADEAKVEQARPGYVAVDGDRDVPALRELRDDAVEGDALADGQAELARSSRDAQRQAAASPTVPTPAPAPRAAAGGGSVANLAAAPEATTALVDKPTVAPAAPSTAPATSMADPAAVKPYNPRSDAATLEWAKSQHARLIKLVEAGKCNEAGTLAASIMRKAPDYYQDQVYNDRRFRACRPYAEKSRRAVEPARKRDLPSPAAADEVSEPIKASD